MIRQHHHLISNILHFLAGGGLGLVSASLAHQFGWQSADRLPGESRWPNCAYCFKPLTWQAATPLFGWLLRPDISSLPCPCGLRKHQWSHPLAEIVGFTLGLAAIQLAGWSPMILPLALGLGLLPALALIDLHFGIIPDELNILIAVFGLWWLSCGSNDFYIGLMVAASMLTLGLFCAFVYSRWRGKEMLGLGDVKFFAAAGLWLQPHMAPWFLTMAGFIGAGAAMTWKRVSGNEESPFAPALCLSLAICVLYQLAQMP